MRSKKGLFEKQSHSKVKSKTWKSKPTTTSMDIPGIKSPEKLKCQEKIVKRSFLVDQELHTNLEIVNNSSTVKFVLGSCQNLSFNKKRTTMT